MAGIYSRGGRTTKQAAAITGRSTRTIQRWTSSPRQEWLDAMAAERETIRHFHDDQGHSWPETAKHFGLHVDTVKRRAYRARKERAREAEEITKGPTLFDIDLDEAS